MPRLCRITVVLALVLLASIALRAQGALSTFTPPAPVQPLPYSHKQHIALGLTCRLCHVNPDAGKLMTYPVTATCMTCHATVAADRPSIQKLATFAAEDKPIPWVRVYQVPDYVFWEHGPHLAAAVTCVECHGPVPERDVIAQETNVVTMLGCRTCHDKRQVFTDCGSCHEPRQQPPRLLFSLLAGPHPSLCAWGPTPRRCRLALRAQRLLKALARARSAALRADLQPSRRLLATVGASAGKPAPRAGRRRSHQFTNSPIHQFTNSLLGVGSRLSTIRSLGN